MQVDTVQVSVTVGIPDTEPGTGSGSGTGVAPALDGFDNRSDYDSSDESDIEETNKQNDIKSTFRRYAAIFHGGVLPNFVKKINPLIAPAVKDEGRRDVKQLKWEKYFGSQSRNDFHGRSSWVRSKIHCMNIEDDIADRVQLTPQMDFDTEFAFAPRRTSKKSIRYRKSINEKKKKEDEEELVDKVASSIVDGSDVHLGQLVFEEKCYNSQPKVVPNNSDNCSVVTLESGSTLNATCTTIEKGAPTSPRTRYIGNCMNNNINPRASLILRKDVSNILDLRHQGMGDDRGIIFAQSLKELPFVQSLDLTDNNLTDVSLHPIIQSVASLSSLTYLNLSQNDVDGDCSKALSTYLAKSDCPLKCLIMQNADVDDDECHRFVTSLMVSNNLNFKELDLSKNIIGKSENLNTVMPDLTTGGEALADLLCANTCHLDTLRLGWNMIRLDGAKELARSIAVSTYVTHLDVSYNALGKEAGEILGKSLLTNKALRYLNISHNNINSTACFTICIALEENNTLRTLILDGNPIGELGLTITCQIPITIGGDISVSTSNCNTKIRDLDDRKIDMNNIADAYELDMSKPFERAIMFKIINIASRNKSYHIENYTVTSPTTNKVRVVKLQRNVSHAKYEALSSEMKNEVASLKKIQEIAENEDLAERMFHEHDDDCSGSLDIDEVEALVKNLGMIVARPVIEVAVSKFDIDGGGLLELTEFLEFIRAQRTDATAKIRELTEGFTISLSKTPHKRYIPPKVGVIKMLVSDAYISTGAKVVSPEDYGHIMNIVLNAKEGRQLLVEHSLKGARLRAKEAFAVYHFMASEIKSPATVLEKLLPSMVNYMEARSIVQQTVQNDAGVMKRLSKTMGGCLNAILGHFNGWYSLDLSKPYDRICLGKLLEQSQAMKEHMMANSVFEYGITGDISQLGDWSSFRNVVIDGQFGIITTEMYNPMPVKGLLHFDFCGADKPDAKASVISDLRFVNCLVQHSVITPAGKAPSIVHLKEMKAECDKHFREGGVFNNNLTEARAKKVQTYMLDFYGNLMRRTDHVRKAYIIEDSKLDGNTPSVVGHIPPPGPVSAKSLRMLSVDESSEVTSSVDDLDSSDSEGDYEGDDEDALLTQHISSPSASPTPSRKLSKRRGHTILHPKQKAQVNPFFSTDYKRKMSVRTAKKNMTSEIGSMKNDTTRSGKCVLCWKIINLLFEVFKNSWLRCRHLAVVMPNFFQGHIKRTKYFGSYRVEMIVMLFHRLVDVQNFDLILKRLVPFEVACLYCRLGYLRLFNPMKPEGAHFLNISNREERVITKIMGALSALEPGENWIDETYQWELDVDVIPGWVLTQTWMTDEGMPPRGFLYVVYYSGEGKQLEGTLPDIDVRKSFLNLVGIEELDLFRDESNFIMEKNVVQTVHGPKEVMQVIDRIYDTPKGKKCAMDNRTLWEVFLTPFNSTSARIARGEKVIAVFDEIRRKTGKDPYNLHVISVVKKFQRAKTIIEPPAAKGNKRKTITNGNKRKSVIKR